MIQAANVGLGIVGKVRDDKGSTYTVDVTVILNHCRKGNRLLWQQISPSLNSDTSADSLSGTAGTGMTYTLHYLLPHSLSYLAPLLPSSYKRSANLSQFVIHRGLIISVMQVTMSWVV